MPHRVLYGRSTLFMPRVKKMKNIFETKKIETHVFYCYANNSCSEEMLEVMNILRNEGISSNANSLFQWMEMMGAPYDLSLFINNYFGSKDLEAIWNLKMLNAKQHYIISRIALKNAVCTFLQREHGECVSPRELYCSHDNFGQPMVHHDKQKKKPLDSLFVSLSHKNNRGVAIASNQPVGIDLEKIENKSEEFIQLAYTKKELSLLKRLEGSDSENLKSAETLIRFWVAKEACAKKTGRGFQGRPQSFEVTKVEDDVLFVGDTPVQTVKIDIDYIVGWTL